MITEKMPSLMMNRLISFCRGVSSSSSPADIARLAICPMKVASPVAKTIPLPLPYLLRVEKKAIFFVYRGLSLVQLTLRSKSSLSPVREELSTFMP